MLSCYMAIFGILAPKGWILVHMPNVENEEKAVEGLAREGILTSWHQLGCFLGSSLTASLAPTWLLRCHLGTSLAA